VKLYHASPIKNLKLIKPQKTISHNKYIGDFVFATKYKKLALMYMLPKGFPILMNAQSKNPYVVICASVEKILKRDGGGALYILPDSLFRQTPQIELNEYEMVSEDSIIPLGEEDYDCVTNELVRENINIYFADSDTFNKLILNPKQDTMVQALDKYLP
jgi:hypothetical protein